MYADRKLVPLYDLYLTLRGVYVEPEVLGRTSRLLFFERQGPHRKKEELRGHTNTQTTRCLATIGGHIYSNQASYYKRFRRGGLRQKEQGDFVNHLI
jgi:hypothetical protein